MEVNANFQYIDKNTLKNDHGTTHDYFPSTLTAKVEFSHLI